MGPRQVAPPGTVTLYAGSCSLCAFVVSARTVPGVGVAFAEHVGYGHPHEALQAGITVREYTMALGEGWRIRA